MTEGMGNDVCTTMMRALPQPVRSPTASRKGWVPNGQHRPTCVHVTAGASTCQSQVG